MTPTKLSEVPTKDLLDELMRRGAIRGERQLQTYRRPYRMLRRWVTSWEPI